MVEAGVGQFQAEGVLPVDATTDGISGLTIGEALDELEHGGQGEPGGGGGRLAAGGEQVGELIVAEEQAEFLGDAKAGTIRCQGQFGVSSSLLLPLRDNSVSVHHYCFPCIKSVSWIHGKTSKTDRR